MCSLTRNRLSSCTCGGIGRRASFRHWFFIECRFKSCHVYLMTLLNLFPCPIIREPAHPEENYHQVQQEILPILKAVEEGDLECVSYIYRDCKKDKQIAKVGNVLPSWQIEDDLIGKYNLVNLERRIYEALGKYLAFIKANKSEQDKDGKSAKIKCSWINIAERGKSHDIHAHPGYDIAGIYYFRVSEDQGGITFNNPNAMVYNGNFPEGQMTPMSMEIIPQDGDLFLFPAWLQHGTRPNKTDDPRVSISFNINIE